MLGEHFSYLSDVQRTRLLRRAISRTVRPADRVLDLGAGVGVLGALCHEAGAAHVTAIERTAVTEITAQVFARSGHGNRSDVVQGLSGRIALSDPVDLIVCDHVGFFALDYGILRLLQDARARFLKPGGRLLPQAVDLLIAPVGSDECARLAHGWSGPDIPGQFHWIAGHSANTKHAIDLKPRDVLGAPARLGGVDFGTETRSFFSWKAEMIVTRTGEMHGLAGWFDCTLCDGVAMTNSPLRSERIDRNQALFPIEDPLRVEPGDTIRAAFAMRPDDHEFAWTVEHLPSGRRFRQATLKGDIFGKRDLMLASPDHVPVPTPDTLAGQIVLGYCDGRRTTREIEAAVLRDHPDLFPTAQAISEFVAGWLGSRTR